MYFLWRSLTAWSPEFTSGDFIFNPVIAYSGMLEIGTCQLNNWRLHEPPDFLPFCQPGALPTHLYRSRMPRHHSRLPGRYIYLNLYFYYLICPVDINWDWINSPRIYDAYKRDVKGFMQFAQCNADSNHNGVRMRRPCANCLNERILNVF